MSHSLLKFWLAFIKPCGCLLNMLSVICNLLNMLLCLSVQLIYIQHHQHHLMQHLSKLELEKGQLYGQLTDMKQKYASCSTENVRLQAQVQALQQQFDQRQQHGVGQAGFHAGGQGQGLPAAQ